MTQIIRKVMVPNIPEKVLLRSIELISEALIKDAKDNFKAKTDLRVAEEKGYIEAYVAFFPYRYDFIWNISRNQRGFDVTLDARTSGKWHEFLFDMDTKLQNLVMTQWSALLNFCMGYITASTYSAGSRISPREHITRAKAGLAEKKPVMKKRKR